MGIFFSMNWLLLRGLSRHALHWGSFTEELRAHCEGEVLALDLPGFGSASKNKSPLSVGGIVEHLRRQFLKEHDPKKSWNLLGLSFGGMVALEWLSLYPEDFNAGAIMNSSLAGICPMSERISGSGKWLLLKCLLKPSPIEKESLILALTSREHVGDRALLQNWETIEIDHPTRITEALKQLLISSRYKGPKNLIPPLLVLSSQKDQLVNPNCSLKIAQKYGAVHWIHPEAGHDLPLDAPQWVIEKISLFANSHGV